MYAAEVTGIGADDPERPIRMLIALMVLCCDPLANRPDGGNIRTTKGLRSAGCAAGAETLGDDDNTTEVASTANAA